MEFLVNTLRRLVLVSAAMGGAGLLTTMVVTCADAVLVTMFQILALLVTPTAGHKREVVLALTCVLVVFSILVQGPTVGRVARRICPDASEPLTERHL